VNPALAAVVEGLEAERLAPVPRASHTVGVDVDDLALVLEHTREVGHTAHDAMSSDVAAAYQRLAYVVCGHVVRGLR
jgi:hypothetical protein